MLIQPVEDRDRPAAVDAGGVGSKAPVIVGLLAVIPATLTVAAGSVPGSSIFSALLGNALWALLALGWIAAMLVSRRLRQASDARRLPWSWALAPAVLSLSCVVVGSGVPLNVRFALNGPAFEQLPDRGLSYDVGATAGMYDICCFEPTDFGYRFGVSEDLSVIWGFAFSPNGPPPGPDIDSGVFATLHEGDNAYRHLDGPWYIWEFVVT